ncbi:S41 family peptidase [Candidatus Peregrinibacteria bacterium]|jgi:carboxyl-terminal processing protease|nr:S41 family peptidase [Candidatus Peregrinibacteria bacterium]MBT3598710.1 S41 family peptidase [Candidatus Peregrinibacteria bacterium]MBT6731280.1 S41 family peptidase [Candidatus Peregrinibacteria bacterium]MBT7008858.1 S41 family peptidase [Candidatus Peregrinibacteria bacterium]MBT7344601.1 S41 family peptidase [Candidatus Peregrinibacteria bacterium]
MSKIFRNISLILLPVIMLALGWELGNTTSRRQLHDVEKQLEFLYTGSVGSGQVIQDPEKEVDFALLYGVWRLLLRYYIQPEDLKVQPMIYGATMGLVNAIGDPYTTFMTPKQNDNFQQSMQGKLEGIGAQLTMKNGNVVVVAPLKGSPAQSAGMKSEDIIVTVDREQITEETLNQVVQRIRGEKGTKVVIGVAREGEDQIIELTITRDEIKVPSTEMEIKETDSGSIGILSINKFGEETARDTEEAIEEMLEKNVIGIILDVRFNGGGYLERAVEMTSLFIQKGKVVSVARRDTEPEHHYVNGRPMTTDIPLVILVNEGSASASEIMAGALQDHKRATIIGVTTFGKGTVQEIFELPGGSSMRITTAHWLMPNGKNLSKEGIDPDIVVERTVDQMKENIDPQLDAAIDLLQNKE